MSLQLVANHLAQKGRGPDSTLVHMSNREVAGLQALAKKHGGELTVNPDTGLPEAGFLDSLIPTIAGAGLTYFSGGAITPMMAAGIVGGISALDSKDLGKGLMAGLGAWGGGSMVGGLAGMGLVGEGAAATATTPASEAAMTALKGDAYKTAVGEGASKFGNMFANKPMEAITSFGGGSGLNAARTAFAAAAPAIMADQNVKTATPAPNRGMIRPQTFSRQQTYPQQEYAGPVSGERRYFNDFYTAGDPYSAANGGLVALARGGYAGATPSPAVGPGNAYFESPEYKAYLKANSSDDPFGMIGTSDMYDSPYFGSVGSGSLGRQNDRAYESYLGRLAQENTPINPPVSSSPPPSQSVPPQENTPTNPFISSPPPGQSVPPQESRPINPPISSSPPPGQSMFSYGLNPQSNLGRYDRQSLFRPTTPPPENNMYGASRDAYNYLMGVNPTSGGGQYPPYDPNRPFPPGMQPRIPEDGMQPDPNKPKTGKGRYEFDPITGQYKFIPDPITPVDIAPPVFEAPVRDVGGGGGGDRNEPEDPNSFSAQWAAMGPAEREAWRLENPNAAIAQDVVGLIASPLKFAYDKIQDYFGPESSTGGPARYERTPVTPDVEADVFGGYPTGITPNPYNMGPGTPDFNPVGTTPGAAHEGQGGYGGVHDGQQGYGQDVGSSPGAAHDGQQGYGQDVGSSPGAAHDGQGGYGGGESSGGGESGGYSNDSDRGDARGGYLQHGRFDQRMAHGGIAALTHQYNLGSYSDGGRLLKGPGDGVSDSIPATIGRGQPARLADGEFVIPARIVSELGNGSTDAGARELYKMMGRIQAGRRKTVGKKQVAKNSKAARHLPA